MSFKNLFERLFQYDGSQCDCAAPCVHGRYILSIVQHLHEVWESFQILQHVLGLIVWVLLGLNLRQLGLALLGFFLGFIRVIIFVPALLGLSGLVQLFCSFSVCESMRQICICNGYYSVSLSGSCQNLRWSHRNFQVFDRCQCACIDDIGLLNSIVNFVRVLLLYPVALA